jgi:hypothetical protein
MRAALWTRSPFLSHPLWPAAKLARLPRGTQTSPPRPNQQIFPLIPERFLSELPEPPLTTTTNVKPSN